jgi:hypothetical protein
MDRSLAPTGKTAGKEACCGKRTARILCSRLRTWKLLKVVGMTLLVAVQEAAMIFRLARREGGKEQAALKRVRVLTMLCLRGRAGPGVPGGTGKANT